MTPSPKPVLQDRGEALALAVLCGHITPPRPAARGSTAEALRIEVLNANSPK
jgi:hypothetical protein